MGETERICMANNREPALALRANSSLITRDELGVLLQKNAISCRPGSYSDEALVLDNFHGQVNTLPGYDEGFFQVQDEAAQLATTLLGPFRNGGSYLDGCAGLGGKTSHLLQFGKKHELQVHALEPDPYRLKKLHENVARLSSGHDVIIHKGRLQELETVNLPQFDGILIDAPCSGTGVTGRHPDIRWNRLPGELQLYQEQQLVLLAHAAILLAPQGVLVYATCSLEPEENRDVINKFLEIHQDFTLTDCSDLLPKSARSLLVNKFFSPRPSAMIDGFFAARMTRR